MNQRRNHYVKTRLNLFAAVVLMASATFSRAVELKFAHIFSDHAILQRDQPVPVWGWADAGAVVTVEFAGQTKNATADASGKWLVKLDALRASVEPRTLTAHTTMTAMVSDVLVGEVWLASGQSNMGVPLSSAHNAAMELPKTDDSLLRFYTVSKSTAAEPQPDVTGKWEASTPVTAKNYSAVAYFFARELRAKLNCPVAVLHSSWGGTPGQAWVSMDALRKEPSLARHVQKYDEALVAYRDVQAHPEKVANYKDELKRWQTEVAPAFNAAMKEYNAKKSTGPKPTPARPEPVNPDPMAIPSPSSRPGTPSVIFNGMIAPLAPYALRGAIWYQGEANGSAGMEYRSLLPCLIGDWRTHWSQGDFTFLIVQLPGWDHDTKPAEQHDWPWLREAQLLTLKNVPKTGLAVGIDIGDPHDVHPKDKLDIGVRLALAARKVAYSENVVHSGPIFQEIKVEGAAVRVKFAETGSALMIGQAPWRAEGVEPLPSDKLIGFTIAGDDRRWFAANAKIEDDCVVVTSPEVPKPVAVRYGWANAPRCNLYNKEGLPASPFRTDEWSISGAAKPGVK